MILLVALTELQTTIDQHLHTRARLDASQHEFLISGSEKLRITSDGKMGLGETTPLGLLHVKAVILVLHQSVRLLMNL